MRCLAQRLKSMFFEKKILVEDLQRGHRVKKKIQKTLILVFEVIVQPPKNTFKIGFFSLAHCDRSSQIALRTMLQYIFEFRAI